MGSPVGLPPGFVLDDPPQAAAGLPPGFVLDSPPAPAAAALPAGFVLDQPKGQLRDIHDVAHAGPTARIYPHGYVIDGPPLSHLGPSHPVTDADRLGLPGIPSPPKLSPQFAPMSQADKLSAMVSSAVADPWGSHAKAMAAAKSSGKPHDATKILPDPQTAQAVNQRSVDATMGVIDALTAPRFTGNELGAPPGLPKPELPYELQSEQQQLADAPTWTNPRSGIRYKRLPPGQGGGPIGSMLDSPYVGGQKIAEGTEQMAAPTAAFMQPDQPGGYGNKLTEPLVRQGAAGLHQIVGGAFEAATPLMVASGIAAPLKTAAAVGSAMLTQTAVETGLTRLGLPREYAAVVGDLAGLVGAHYGSKAAEAIKARIEPILQQRFRESSAQPASPRPAGLPEGFVLDPPPQETIHDTQQPTPRPLQGQPAPSPAQGQEASAGAVPEARQQAGAQDAGTSQRSQEPVGQAQAVEPWRMTRDELQQHHANLVQQDAGLLESLFGAEGAQAYNRAQRTANSAMATPERANAAQATIDQMEGPLTDPQRNKLFGIGEDPNNNLETVKDYADAVGRVDASTPESAAQSIMYALTKIGDKTDPAEMTHPERVALAQLNTVFRESAAHGFDINSILKSALVKASGRFADPADAEMMLQRFMKPQGSEAAPAPRLTGNIQPTAAIMQAGSANMPEVSNGVQNIPGIIPAAGLENGLPPKTIPAAPQPIESRPEQGGPNSGMPLEASPVQPTAPIPGTTATVPTSSLSTDPANLQYKQGVGRKGVTDKLQDVETYDPELAGTLAVWYEPATGKTWVANGHHRFELAERVGYPTQNVLYLDAKSKAEARAKAALMNIAEDQGTPLDAAMLFRDLGITPADLKARHIAINGKVARAGLGLANLDPSVFSLVASGDIQPDVAAVVGEMLPGRDSDQRAVVEAIDKAEKSGHPMNAGQVRESIRVGMRPDTDIEETQATLFGDITETRSLFREIGHLSEYVRKQLSSERRLFSAVGSNAAAERLGGAGNVIKADENARIAATTTQAAAVYDKLSGMSGPVSDAIAEGAKELASGKSARDVERATYEKVRAAISQTLGGREGEVPGGLQARGENGSGEAGAGEPSLFGDPQSAEVAPVEPEAAQLSPGQAAFKVGLDKAAKKKAANKVKLMGARGPAGNTPDDSSTLGQGEGSPLPSSPAISDSKAVESEVKAEAPAGPPADAAGPVTLGSGLGAFEPFFKESIAEGNALREKRNAAFDALKKAIATPEQQHAGELARAYFTSERDLWAARMNQVIDKVKRVVVPNIQDREAIGIYREFKSRREELVQFLNGDHQMMIDHRFRVSELQEGGKAREQAQKVYDQALDRLGLLRPEMEKALDWIDNGMPPAIEAGNKVFTQIAADSLAEGQKGGWLESRWTSDQYMPHALHKMNEGLESKPPSTEGKTLGKIGKFFGFGERRSDPYPTMLHAIADGLVPKTLDPAAAFTIHADTFARARATHMFEEYLQSWGLGQWGEGRDVPQGWVPLAPHSEEFKRQHAYMDDAEAQPKISSTRLYVPAFISKALKPLTSPDFLAQEIPGFAKLRSAQRELKRAILGFSGFHLVTENFMAAADVGPKGMYNAFRADRQAPWFEEAERDFIGAGGTTSIQGATMDAYRGLQPGTIPTRGEIWRAYLPGAKHALGLADAITRLTFDNVQRRFKVVSFQLHRDAWMNDNPNASWGEINEAKKGIASYVNGVYGGLHWENMGVPRAVVEVARALLLAPDWTGSNVALAKYAVDAPLSTAEFKGSMAGATTKEASQARLSRAFWVKQMVGGLVANQLLSVMFSGQHSKRPFQVYLGTTPDGREKYSNIVFRGSAGDLVSLGTKMQDYGFVSGTGTFLAGKAAPFTKAGVHQLTRRNDFGREFTRKGLNPIASTVRSAAQAVTDVSPIPITGKSLYNTSTGDDADQYVWSDRVLSLIGQPPQLVAPAGEKMTRKGLRGIREKPENSIWEQIKTGNLNESRRPRDGR